MTNVESLVGRFSKPPRIEETGPRHGHNGKRMAALGLRTRMIHLAMCVLGLLPYALWVASKLGAGISVHPILVSIGLGFVVPGGGFLGCGGPVTIAFGLFVCFYLWKKKGMMMQDFLGSFLGLAGYWALGIVGGVLSGLEYRFIPYVKDYIFSGDNYLFIGLAAVIFAFARLFGRYELQVRKMYRGLDKARAERLPIFDDAMRELDDATAAAPEITNELDDEGILAARYLLDATVREIGDFDGFEHLFGLADYRYQLSVYGYGLMLLHRHYLPNFTGYLKRAHRYLVKSYESPRTCGYWAKEAKAGYFSNNPDPVVKANVMLSGWMMPVVAGYRDPYGDDEFERDASIRFQPFEDKPDETYDYSSPGVFNVLYRQFKNHEYPYMLIPCEPHVAFPACNSVGLFGMLVYDRDHGTNYCESFWDELYDNVQSDFIEIDGSMALRRQYQYGLRHMPASQIGYDPLADVQNYMHFSAIFPGLARRCYALVRKTMLGIDDNGEAYVKDRPWESMFNMFVMRPDPSTQIGMLEITAAEYGDIEFYNALRKVEGKYLFRTLEPGGFKFKDINSLTTAYFALGRLMKKGFWSDVILRGMPETSKTGPILSDCSYPDVLPAKAVSNGEDLDLVLTTYTPGEYDLSFERLVPNREYTYKNGTFTASSEGTAKITVNIGERTPIHIQ